MDDRLEALLLEMRGDLMAHQQILAALLIELSPNPDLSNPIFMAIDAAANTCERLSIEFGERARHFTKALETVERIRAQVKGEQEKRHGV